ncbi:hypothetical protein BKA70DRAFT_1431332 [Coprinopsis sp. MPI-PUGE-AT-0042]|nr:hypothetical protein BKA70DRAFT_1431332 [Coprinopsis sp. MPI-PUGE-AT-0042]
MVQFSKHQHHALFAASARPSADGEWAPTASIEATVRFPSGSRAVAQPCLSVTRKTHRLWRERPQTRTKAKDYTSETQVAESLPTNLQRTYWALVEHIYEDIASNSGGPHTWLCGLAYRIEAGVMYEHTCTYTTSLSDTHYLNHILAEHGIGYNPDWQVICHWKGLESTICSPASLVKHLREKYLIHTAPVSTSHQGETLYSHRRTMKTTPKSIHGHSFPSFTYREEPSRRETMMRHMRPQIVDWFKYLMGEYQWPKWAGKAPEADNGFLCE